MNDEIKEIISYLKKKENTRRIKCITTEETTQLLDYITNLQEENERLKDTQIFIDTQDPEERCGQSLYEEMLKRDCENYKQRIDKALEYIPNCGCDDEAIDNIKDILRGDE